MTHRGKKTRLETKIDEDRLGKKRRVKTSRITALGKKTVEMG